MNRRFLASMGSVLILAFAGADEHVVASSGTPQHVLLNDEDRENPTQVPATLHSGYVDGDLVWTAFQFWLSKSTTISRVAVYCAPSDDSGDPIDIGSLVVGVRIYADTNAAPGQLLATREELSASGVPGDEPACTGSSLGTAASLGRLAFDLGEDVTLGPGSYWATIYGMEGQDSTQYDLRLIGGAPGGSTNEYALQSSNSGTLWSAWTTGQWIMPSFREDLFGASRNAAEMPAKSIYRAGYEIYGHNSAGAEETGSSIDGVLGIANWCDGHTFDYYDEPFCEAYQYYPASFPVSAPWQLNASYLNVDLYLFAGTGNNEHPQIICTLDLRLLGTHGPAHFTTLGLQPGTYRLEVHERPYTVWRWGCIDNGPPPREVHQTNFTGFGHSFLSVNLGAVTIADDTAISLGVVDVGNGDTNIDGIVNLFDLNMILATYGCRMFNDPECNCNCVDNPPDWECYFMNNDTNYDGIIDMFDVNTVLANWGLQGPSRW